ncbi:hypothetical protein [Roseivivax halotolerans]|uniref:hypothetical protein n=1 Tax=Roseivivax halotolerans TaxID=93684 RepID=UPI0011139617|nr:hypothetical protein [Roseivivax halotolerans]
MNDKRTVKGDVVVLDYADLRNTRYERCKMIYRGGRPPTLVNNDFVECEWIFENEAQNTLRFLKALVEGGGEDLVLASLGVSQNG